MKKLIFLTLLFCFASSSVFAEDKLLDERQEFIAKQNQISEQRQQEIKEKFKIPEAKEVSQEQPSTEDVLKNPDQATNVPTIDCNNKYSKDNYPSNYLYDYQQMKTYQLNPFAKCKASVPETPITTKKEAQIEVETPTAPTTQSATQGVNWNINY